jgi:hypothetical protein
MNDLLTLLNTGVVSGDLALAVQQISRISVYVIAQELASWLRRQRVFGHTKPLRLPRDHQWVDVIPKFLESFTPASSLFEVKGDELDFKASVPADVRDSLRLQIVEGYRPTLRTKKV